MKIIKTASQRLLKLNKQDWLHIGKMAGWISYWCPYCDKSYKPDPNRPDIKGKEIVEEIQEKDGEKISVFKTYDPGIPEYEYYPTHGICPQCYEEGMAFKKAEEWPINKPKNA